MEFRFKKCSYFITMSVGKSLGRMIMGDSTIFFDSLKKSVSLRKHSALLPQRQGSKASGPSISPGFWVPVLTMATSEGFSKRPSDPDPERCSVLGGGSLRPLPQLQEGNSSLRLVYSWILVRKKHSVSENPGHQIGLLVSLASQVWNDFGILAFCPQPFTKSYSFAAKIIGT